MDDTRFGTGGYGCVGIRLGESDEDAKYYV
jgi:hypothetical protein